MRYGIKPKKQRETRKQKRSRENRLRFSYTFYGGIIYNGLGEPLAPPKLYLR